MGPHFPWLASGVPKMISDGRYFAQFVRRAGESGWILFSYAELRLKASDRCRVPGASMLSAILSWPVSAQFMASSA